MANQDTATSNKTDKNSVTEKDINSAKPSEQTSSALSDKDLEDIAGGKKKQRRK